MVNQYPLHPDLLMVYIPLIALESQQKTVTFFFQHPLDYIR